MNCPNLNVVTNVMVIFFAFMFFASLVKKILGEANEVEVLFSLLLFSIWSFIGDVIRGMDCIMGWMVYFSALLLFMLVEYIRVVRKREVILNIS